jgi:amidohydrolase
VVFILPLQLKSNSTRKNEMNVKAISAKHKKFILEMRRHFHTYPELSFEEVETTAFIAAQLCIMGIAFERKHKTGVVGIIKGRTEGKVIALRADIDALNVIEKNEFNYKSKNEGKMHACGHDAHIAMLLGAAKVLNEIKEQFKGTVYLIFQPAEEVAQGAKQIMAEGDWYGKIDNIFGVHVWSFMETGKVSVQAGGRMAAADWFEINVKGKSGHGSMPNQGVDAVLIASSIVINLQALVSRETSPLEPLVITVGRVNAGTRFNIVAGDAFLEGTTRYFSNEIAGTLEENMKRVIEGTAKMYNGEAVLKYKYIVPPLVNEERSSKLAEYAASKIYGVDNVISEPQTTGGEDFAHYLEKKPGCFAFIGTANVEKGTNVAHHNEYFDVDEDALVNGSALYAQYAIDFLTEYEKYGF